MADVRVNELPDFSGYGDLAPSDLVVLYMVSVDKTVKVPLSALSTFLGALGSSTQLSTPALSLAVIADDEIDASWPAVTSATAYKLYRSETSLFSDAELIYTGSSLLFNDTGLAPGTLYYYWLQATASGFLDSGYSQASDTTTEAGVDTTPPVLSSAEVPIGQPSVIVLTYNETLQTVSSALTTQWSLPGYTINHVSISGTTVTIILNQNIPPLYVPLLNYTGSAVKDTAGNLAATFTNQPIDNHLFYTGSKLTTPRLTAQPGSSSEIDLFWSRILNESSFLLEISTDGTSWTTLDTPAAGETTYTASGLSSSSTYWFRIKAIGDGTQYTDSDYSSASATTYPAVGAAFDTILTFVSASSDNQAGVNGAASTTSATRQFQFNAIAVRTGTPMTMKIRVTIGGITVTGVIIDFPSDYNGQAFKYIHSNGNEYSGFFANTTVNF